MGKTMRDCMVGEIRAEMHIDAYRQLGETGRGYVRRRVPARTLTQTLIDHTADHK